MARHHETGRPATRRSYRWLMVGVAVGVVFAGCSSAHETLRLPFGQPAGELSGGIVFHGRVPPEALSGRYRVIVMHDQKLVRSEGLGAHDTYGWLLPPGQYTVQLFSKLVAPQPLVKHALVRFDTRTHVNFEIFWH
jgi:hypothetical protein